MPVKPSIAAGLLAYAASTDNRQPSEEAAHGWAAALDEHVTLTDGKTAIDRHRATTADWLMPAHVNAEVRRIRKARADALGDVVPPAELADRPAMENAWTREYRRSWCDGDPADVATKRACDAVGIQTPAQIEGTRRMPSVAHVARRIPEAE